MYRYFFLALTTLLLYSEVRAETVTLRQALQAAVQERPFARAARLEATAAEAALGEARSRFLPTVSLRETFTATDEPATSLFMDLNQEELELSQDPDFYNFPGTHRDFETRLALEQPLFAPDIYYGWQRARAGAAAAAAGANWSAERAAFAAFQAYLEVQQAGAALEWVTSSRREAEEIERVSRERHEAGLGLKSDLLRARVFLAEAGRRQVTAANDLAIARRGLALAMGRNGTVEIAGPLEPQILQEQPATEVLRREDLTALAYREQAAKLAHRQSQAAYLPRLGLTAAYTLHDGEAPFGTDGESWMVGAGLSWTIFDGLGRHYASARTAAEARALEANREEAWRQASFQLAEAQDRAEEARIQLASAGEAVILAEESHRLMLQRFQAGLANLSDLLTAQAALDRARFDVVTARSRYMLSLGNILLQRGIFTQALLPLPMEATP